MSQPETKEPRYTLEEESRERIATRIVDASDALLPAFQEGRGASDEAVRAAYNALDGLREELDSAFTQPQHPDSETCEHEWVDPTNEAVEAEGHELCVRCGKLRKADCETRETVPDEAVELAIKAWASFQAGNSPAPIRDVFRDTLLAALPPLEAAWKAKHFAEAGALLEKAIRDEKERVEAAWRKRLEEELLSDRVLDAATGAAFTQPISQNRREDMKAAFEAALKDVAG